jgi:DNA-binding transcriptional ArsR family regulator
MVDPEDPKDLDAERNWMMERWHEYGREFGVFVPEQQPAPEVWEPDLPPPDEKGRLDPQVLKHWEQLFPTKDFLRERYAKYHLLEGPTLDFNCLVPKFHDRITHTWMEDALGNPLPIPVDDKHEWYDGALRIGIFVWQVGFSCRSRSCERVWCDLHRKNPKRISPMDIYGLVALFEEISLVKAKDEVAKWFGVKLGPLKSKDVRDTSIPRRRVPKKAVYDLIGRYPTMKHQHVKSFVEEAQKLITESAVVPWHRRLFEDYHAFLSNKVIKNLYAIGDPAIKAYLWLLIHQEEEARQNRWSLKVTDGQLAEALGVSRPTAGKYRERLKELKLVDVEVKKSGRKRDFSIKSVKY